MFSFRENKYFLPNKIKKKYLFLPKDGNPLDDDDLSDAESVHDYDKDSSNSSGVQGDKLPIEILEPIKALGLVEKLWQRAQPIAENVDNLLKEGEKNLAKKYEIHHNI